MRVSDKTYGNLQRSSAVYGCLPPSRWLHSQRHDHRDCLDLEHNPATIGGLQVDHLAVLAATVFATSMPQYPQTLHSTPVGSRDNAQPKRSGRPSNLRQSRITC